MASHGKSNARNGLVKMNGFSVVTLCFVIRKSTNNNKDVIAILFKSVSYAGEGIFPNTNLLKGNNIRIKC